LTFIARSQRAWRAETWSKLVALTHGRLECGTTAGTSGTTERAVRPARAAPAGERVLRRCVQLPTNGAFGFPTVA